MRDEDQPPEAIWLDDEAMSLHFKRVKDRYASGSSDMEPIEELEQNESTRRLKR